MLELLVMQPTSQSHHVLQHIVLKKVEQGMQNDHNWQTSRMKICRSVSVIPEFWNSLNRFNKMECWLSSNRVDNRNANNRAPFSCSALLWCGFSCSFLLGYSSYCGSDICYMHKSVCAVLHLCDVLLGLEPHWSKSGEILSIPSQPIQSMPTDLHYVRWTSRSSTI